MKTTTRRPLFALPALVLLLGASTASAATFVIEETTDLFTPSFRGESNTTYFGWVRTPEGGAFGSPGSLNGTPNVNPGSFADLLTQTGGLGIASSGNIYSSVDGVTAAGVSLRIPTAGIIGGGTGYTTIIVQGRGTSGAMFGAPGLGGWGFGAIDGVEPEYVFGGNAASQGQWWAKWEIEGSAENYTVDIIGMPLGDEETGEVVSVTDLVVDTWTSTTGFATDTAAIPEPSALILSAAGIGMLIRRRR